MERETPENLYTLPERLPVAVIMERTPVTGNRWLDHRWEALAVTIGERRESSADDTARMIHQEGGIRRLLYPGFEIVLQIDECESYYHNLMSPYPRCYVIATVDEEHIPVPRLVSLSFDEAHAYMEGEEELYAVDLPPELYRWIEGFVLSHYVPVRRQKRKLEHWSDSQGGGCRS